MKTFAKEVLSGPKLWRIQTRKHKYEWEWEGSLNNTIQALSMEMVRIHVSMLVVPCIFMVFLFVCLVFDCPHFFFSEC